LSKIKVADYIINHLAEIGVSDVFVVYGAANGNLIDAFTRNDKINYVATMHEQGAGFAAEGYAKVSKNLGVAIATSGPGGMNLVTSMGNCFYDSVPCLFMTGQIKTKYMRPDDSIRQIGFQESDMTAICQSVTKYSKLVDDPKSIKFELEKAIYLAKSGRPGPVHLDLPIDVQKEMIDPDELIGFDAYLAEKSFNLDKINQQIDIFLNDLLSSKRPCMMIGGGIRLANAEKEMLELARILKIPCFPTWNALDIIASDFEFYGGRIGTYGGAGRNFGIQNSDLLLAIGSRISGRITGGDPYLFARGAKKYMVDVDAAAMQRKMQQLPFDECILSDAKLFINLLINRVKDMNLPDFSAWQERVVFWREKYDPVTADMWEPTKYVNPYVFLRILSEEMDSNDVLVGDCGGNIVAINHSFKTKTGQHYFTNNGNSPMGFSYSGAMGARFACKNNKDKKVVCVIGDGGMAMNIQEMQTFLNYDVDVKTIILNNHIYGITKAFQEVNFEGRSEACGPKGYKPPDFVKVANAFGINTMVIDDGSDYNKVRKQIREFLDYDGQIICDLNCHEWHTYEPKLIGWETPIEDMYPYLAREEFLENMIIKPLEISLNPERLVYPTIAGTETME
jgi:acetolactate synthase I/II/III large subunit